MTNDISRFRTLKSVLTTLSGHNLLPLDRTMSHLATSFLLLYNSHGQAEALSQIHH